MTDLHSNQPQRRAAPEWTLADRLRKIRRDVLGLTQSEIADQLGVGVQAYSAWETGRNQPDDLLTLAVRLEQISGVERTWVVGWHSPASIDSTEHTNGEQTNG